MTENINSRTGSPLAHFAARLGEAEVVMEPYPHYYVENVFPDDYYRELLAHLPESAVYQNLFEVTTLKLDHFRHRDQRDFNEGWTKTLPGELREFWENFNRWFLSPELAQAVLHSFAAQLPDEKSWPEVAVESQLIRHRAGYFLGPHSDLYTKLVVLLIYLAPDESASHLGTSLYVPKEPGFRCPAGTHYQFEDFVRVKTVPYRPNSLLAFRRSDISFHGVEPLSEDDITAGGRDLIQYVLYDKEAREAQLRERREAAERATA
ncbi:MAG TPA: 2OG-Fe(II) oxygenase [Pyrinomonadaceae bacterium]|nr:2OG-Fe(II) oxygenase [Pyrinomonadaceae bacterium]